MNHYLKITPSEKPKISVTTPKGTASISSQDMKDDAKFAEFLRRVRALYV